MKGLRRPLGYLIAALLVGYFVWFATRALDPAALGALAEPVVLAAVLAAAVLYALILPITAWAWTRLLARQGERWRVRPLLVLLGRVQLAKYIPGNVAQHAGRALLAIRAGMGGRTVAVTVMQETLFAVAASLLVGASALAASAQGVGPVPLQYRAGLSALGIGAMAAVLVLALLDLPPERLLASRYRLARLVGHFGGLPGAGVVSRVVAAYSLNYLLIGLGLWLVVRAAGLPQALDLPLVTAAFALSWVLGFLAPGAPAGLGVREGIMLLLLSGTVSGPDAVAFVLLARVVTLLGDGLGYLMSWIGPGSPGPATTEAV